jgi:hypothetical protein
VSLLLRAPSSRVLQDWASRRTATARGSLARRKSDHAIGEPLASLEESQGLPAAIRTSEAGPAARGSLARRPTEFCPNSWVVSEERSGSGAIMRLILTVVLCCWALSTASAQDRRGYAQDTAISDGPITYGTGMNDADRQKAWKHFFSLLTKAVASQQGQDALGVKLARRCVPGQDFCTTALDANLVGISGIQEPRTVLVVVVTDAHDQNKQLLRMVCTRPAKDKQVCRDWSTGKLVTE